MIYPRDGAKMSSAGRAIGTRGPRYEGPGLELPKICQHRCVRGGVGRTYLKAAIGGAGCVHFSFHERPMKPFHET
jgi:hypothetical protein